VIILGIDPGLANTGWGVVETSGSNHRCVAYGCITTSAEDGLPDRLSQIHTEIRRVVERYAPVDAAIEQIYFGANAKSAFATGQARGVAILALAECGMDLGEYSPPEIKNTVVGSGTADKGQVQYMVRVLLGLPHDPTPDHAADALAIAICHAHLRTAPARAEAR
jgi:crossover junction endodeoxyribonuclease RuvC